MTQGGDLVLAAEQEPDCVDWIGSCAGSSWGYWMMGSTTMPRAFDVSPQSTYVPSPIMDGEPKVDQGPPVKITYKIKKDAVWSDGQPITSTDIKYTWTQITTGKDIYDTTGYDKIQSVDDSDPKTAVVTFKEPYAGYHDLFGAFYGILPSHILQSGDRDALTKDGYTWSGGPWKIDHWTKGQEVKLVPNTAWPYHKPNLNSITFKFITDTSAELQAYKTGQASGGYPQPQVELIDQLKGSTGIQYQVNAGLSYEGLWFNTQKGALQSQAVRQALGYATDRQAIVNQLLGPVKSDVQVLNQFISPANKQFYEPSFSKYTHDVNKVTQLMQGDGWAKGSDGIWAKGGQRASFTMRTTAGNKGREQVEQLLQSQWKDAGFELKIDNQKAGTLFGQSLPKGDFDIAMYAQVPTPDPGECTIWCSQNIPTAANSFSGNNWDRLASPTLDADWAPADKELDQSKRAQLIKKGFDDLAEEIPALPLYPKLTTVVWATNIGGPVGDNFVLGPFWNADQWYLKK